MKHYIFTKKLDKKTGEEFLDITEAPAKKFRNGQIVTISATPGVKADGKTYKIEKCEWDSRFQCYKYNFVGERITMLEPFLKLKKSK